MTTGRQAFAGSTRAALFDSILQNGGLAVTMIDTNAEHVRAIRSHGLKVIGDSGDRIERIAACPAMV